MKLTAEQTEDLPFPIGCPVWYNFPEEPSCDTEAEESPILKQGVVESVSFNYSAKDLLYEVVYKDEDGQKKAIIEEVSEHKLAYGANCPVTIDCNGDESAVEEGTILLCEPSSSDPNKILYTVMIFMEESQARYEFGMDAKRIKYRKEKADTNIAHAAKTDAPVTDNNVHEDQPPAPKNNDPPGANISGTAHPEKEPVPSSITCDSVSKNSHQNSGGKGVVASSNKRELAQGIASPLTNPTKNPRVDIAARTTNDFDNCRQDSHRSINSYSHESVSSPKSDTRFKIKTPSWLQNNRDSQHNLFFHLIGSKDKYKSGNRRLKDVERESNCSIRVNSFDNHSGSFLHPMIITVDARSRSSAMQDKHFALVKIKDLLLDYVGRDGSRGRLVYDVASSCAGGHRPKASLSRAVRMKDPFAEDRGEGMMTIVNLPFDVVQGKKTFHVDYLLASSFLNHIGRDTKCYVKVCMNAKLCDPYLLVMGKDWRGVDRAFEKLNQAIKEHMHTCSCIMKK